MPKALHWFRKDLRLADNPALTTAAKHGAVLPIYVLCPNELAQMGRASKLWLRHSLAVLNQTLDGRLRLLEGGPDQVIPDLVQKEDISFVSWTRRYDPLGVAQAKSLMEKLRAAQIPVSSLNGSLLWEPWEVSKEDGTPYRVFTPFFKRGCAAAPRPRPALPVPRLEVVQQPAGTPSLTEKLGQHLQSHRWHDSVIAGWHPGEAGAHDRLATFLTQGLTGYKAQRDIPARPATSRLSPYLHFGEISPNQLWQASFGRSPEEDQTHFRSELAWREFSYHLLFRHPELDIRNLNPKFDAFPWRDDAKTLASWQQGQTGVPLVDAGMRELWTTGYMHNRIRMVVASFLVKNLRQHWRHGLAWFHDTLFDADPANNAASWQWVAGSGADAAPYFRIFNPVAQAQKFDPDAAYIKTHVPELASLPDRYIAAPWTAPKALHTDIPPCYLQPIVDLKESRQQALDAFKGLS